jgi:hypothetical protein
MVLALARAMGCFLALGLVIKAQKIGADTFRTMGQVLDSNPLADHIRGVVVTTCGSHWVPEENPRPYWAEREGVRMPRLGIIHI